MVIANQDRPVLPRLLMTRRFPGPARHHFGARLGAPKGVSASIHRILQNRQNGAVAGRLPVDMVSALAIAARRYRDLLRLAPEQDLPYTAEFLKFSQSNGTT